MTIYISGGGDVENYAELDRHLRDVVPKGSKLLIIPVANDPSEYDDVKERVQETLGGKKFATIDMVGHLSEIVDLDAYAAIYIDGGNTFALIEEIRSSSFTEQVGKYVASGGHVYGDSAGGIIMGSDVSTAYLGADGDDNIAHLQSFHGLRLVDNWSVHCHYEGNEDEEITDLVFRTGSPIIALSEESGAVIHQSQDIQAYGTTGVALFTFTGKVTVEPGQTKNLEQVLS